MLVDLFPLLCQSVDWFEGLVVEKRAMSEVRSSELDTRLSSSDDLVEVVADIAASDPREIKAFHAFGEVCCYAPNPIPGFVTMTGMLISSLILISTRTNLTFPKILQKLSSFFSFLFLYLII